MRKFLQTAATGLLALGVLSTPARAGVDLSGENVIVTSLGSGNYSFTQSGWSGGGTITGTFTGFDDDGDLQLNSFFGEITAFSVGFSGNGQVPAFSLGFADLEGLVFDLDGSNLLGDGTNGYDAEGIAAIGFNSLYFAGPGPYDICGQGFECAFAISYVPEAPSWAMLIAGFGLTGAMMRRQRVVRAA